MAKFSTTGICTWKLLKYCDDDENAHQNEMDGESDESYRVSGAWQLLKKRIQHQNDSWKL